MARASLLQLSGIGLGFGGKPLFEGADLVVHEGDRLALVGRNGSGKSTLLRVMAGLVEPDSGKRSLSAGVRAGYMEQEPDLAAFDTLGAFAARNLAPGEEWRVEAAAEGLDFDPERPVATASGGERRRAALAGLLGEEPELLLLDEPTNHLDIAAIGWLEDTLRARGRGMVLISHDRAVLRALSTGVLWVDRGRLRRLDRGFDHFESWQEEIWANEEAERHKLDQKIKAEARWAVEGISARRKRNQGRLRALGDLRTTRAGMRVRSGVADMRLEAGEASGRLVIEAEGVALSLGGQPLLRDLSLRLMRGDRLAVVGPNGVGKTTLLRVLLGEIAPDAGRLRHGTKLEVAVFDQNRAALDPAASLWESLTLDPVLGVQGQSDQVMVRGQPRHVVAYLKDFLFDEAQARQPVSALSGGERARLLLARIMARNCNLLVLDEPTNDLDIETLDLLQDLLSDFAGTVLMVSHDRDFIDRVATATLLMEGEGRVTTYAGGWSDLVAQRGGVPGRGRGRAADSPPPVATPTPEARARKGGGGRKPGLSFSETHRLEKLPGEIARLEEEIGKLSALLSDPDLYARDPARFDKATAALVARQQTLARAEEEWLSLAERAEAAGQGGA
ncbi:MAG: ATP-binding cassette domain-containing protein [Rhodobacteraceae bacterium]|nr:ATP-binding cassette domain-containing protein [Paracoccaceae bacterium]